MNPIKITKTDNFNYLRTMVENSEIDLDTKTRLLGFIDRELELIQMRSAKCKTYQQEHAHKADTDEMTAKIYEVLSQAEDALSVSAIVDLIPDSTAQKVVYRLGRLFKDGKIAKDAKAVQTDNGVPRRITFYKAVV